MKWKRFQSMQSAARVAIAAMASLLVARACRMPEAYWAAITTIIIMQSTFGAAWSASVDRLAGTAMGAVAGALIGNFLPSNVYSFGAGIFALSWLCPLLRLNKPAVRFSGVTFAIVVLIQHGSNHWIIATHRFIEVSIGILVGLLVTAIWPEREPATPAQSSPTSAKS